jgi:DNA repair protein RecN (Recombination protein N)
MLISLQIENFALVDQLDLEFGAGLNVLTGETGAGKSIILDALDAALGGKVSSRAIRTGAERALIEATFDLDPSLISWLAEQQIELVDDMTLVCSREVVAGRGNVRSRSRVNGVLVNKQQMEFLRDRLLEITAQGQTLQLGQPTLQREWLDGFGGMPVIQQREVVTAAYQAAQQALQALEKRRQFEQQRLQQLDLFEYQAKELSAANLSDPDELEQLEQERQRLSHSVELQQQSYRTYQALYQNDNGESACADLLGEAEGLLMDMLRYDPQLQPILDMVTEALAQVEEAGRQINAYGESLETDPERLQAVEERIVQLKQICRKSRRCHCPQSAGTARPGRIERQWSIPRSAGEELPRVPNGSGTSLYQTYRTAASGSQSTRSTAGERTEATSNGQGTVQSRDYAHFAQRHRSRSHCLSV